MRRYNWNVPYKQHLHLSPEMAAGILSNGEMQPKDICSSVNLVSVLNPSAFYFRNLI